MVANYTTKSGSFSLSSSHRCSKSGRHIPTCSTTSPTGRQRVLALMPASSMLLSICPLRSRRFGPQMPCHREFARYRRQTRRLVREGAFRLAPNTAMNKRVYLLHRVLGANRPTTPFSGRLRNFRLCQCHPRRWPSSPVSSPTQETLDTQDYFFKLCAFLS
jgi:hypothetical protein